MRHLDLDASTILWELSVYADISEVATTSYRGIEHGDVINEDILYDVNLGPVLAQRANGNAVRSIAVEVLDGDVGAIGLERHAIWPTVSSTL